MWKIYEDNITVKLYKDSTEGRMSMANEKYNGLEAYKRNDYNQAILETTKGIAVYPDFYAGYCVRGASYTAQGELDKAQADITKAIVLNPEMPNGYKELGDINIKQDKTDEALVNYNKAIKIKPDYFEALFSRGHYYNSINNRELAKADLVFACKNGSQRACNYQF